MELTTKEVEAHTRYVGYGGYQLAAGERVVIQVAGETVLNHACPQGKALVLTISVRAELTDAE